MTKQFLDFTELEAQDEKAPIWALNNAHATHVGSPGDVVVGVPKINGSKVDSLHLPQTWLPCLLTAQISRTQLIAASEFRNAVLSGLIKPITVEYAELLNGQDGAAEERDRLEEQKRNIRTVTAARGINADLVDVQIVGDVTSNPGATVHGEGGKPPETAEQAQEEVEASLFDTFVERIREEDDVAAMNRIRSRGSLKGSQIKQLLAVCASKPKTTKLLKEALASRKAA